MTIKLENVSIGYDKAVVIDNINLCFSSGHFYCLLGANGIGKTTLFKTILGFLPVIEGKIDVDDRPLKSFSTAELSECIAYVPQARNYSYDISVLDVVVMGRARFIKKFSQPSAIDYEISESHLARLGVENLANKQYSELSGGEQQIVLIARALAQEAQFVIMDEPASNLDYENQKRVLECLEQLSDSGMGIILSSHSPNHALYCNMEVVLIDKKKKIHKGLIADTLTDELLRDVYGVNIQLINGITKDGIEVQTCYMVK